MPAALFSNALLLARATTLRSFLNTGLNLRLFTNSLTPTPATPLSAFTEATFTGYTPLSLSGQFGPPILVTDGLWQIDSGVLTWSCTGGSGETINGWYLDDGTQMLACQLLDTPVVIGSGGVYTLEIRPQEIAQSIL